eukprot:GHVS01045879.1.p2 GENE.GHVS01045879.1~~GHVS01045879.1.p2  ORF type:complete len:103 (+),score=1.93 GHVS01045879.1:540-848(+)
MSWMSKTPPRTVPVRDIAKLGQRAVVAAGMFSIRGRAGTIQVPILCDTGASMSLIDPLLASELQREGTAKSSTVALYTGEIISLHCIAPSRYTPVKSYHYTV